MVNNPPEFSQKKCFYREKPRMGHSLDNVCI